MTLDDCINYYKDTCEMGKLEEYLDKMPCDERGKEELIDALNDYDLEILYNVLLDKFEPLLSPEEYVTYFAKCITNFTGGLDESPDLKERANEYIEELESLKEEENQNDEKKNNNSRFIDLEGIVVEVLENDNEERFFTVVNERDEIVECEKIFTFDYDYTGKSYIVYTDNSVDEEDGCIRVFASVLTPEEQLAPIETEDEWEVIEQMLELLRKHAAKD